MDGDRIDELTRGQRKNPPVGSGESPAVFFEASLAPSSRLLVMTDGVWKYVGWERLFEIVRKTCGAVLLEELQHAARLPRTGLFQDDFTIAMLESDARDFS